MLITILLLMLWFGIGCFIPFHANPDFLDNIPNKRKRLFAIMLLGPGFWLILAVGFLIMWFEKE